MQVVDKKYMFLLSETIAPTKAGIDLFKSSLQGGIVRDPDTGDKINIMRWKQIVSNASKKTGNNNLFPKMDIAPALDEPFAKNRLDKNAFFNEFQHPTRNDPERYVQVWDSMVSDRINKFWWETLDGDDVLIAECETATYSYGPELRKKIISGAVPAKSLRAAGELYRDSQGRERKRLNIISYDNVFMPADSFAWGDMTSMQKQSYCESLRSGIIKGEANDGIENVRRLFTASAIENIDYVFEDIANEKKFIAESIGFTPDKIILSQTNRNIIAYVSESSRVVTTINEKLRNDIDSFLKI